MRETICQIIDLMERIVFGDDAFYYARIQSLGVWGYVKERLK